MRVSSSNLDCPFPITTFRIHSSNGYNHFFDCCRIISNSYICHTRVKRKCSSFSMVTLIIATVHVGSDAAVSYIIDPDTFTANHTGTCRSHLGTKSDRIVLNTVSHVGGLTAGGRLDLNRSRTGRYPVQTTCNSTNQ